MSEATTTTTGAAPDVVLEAAESATPPSRWQGRRHAPVEAGLIVATAIAVTVVEWNRAGPNVVALAAAALLLAQIAALPAYDRWTSQRPVKRLLVVAGAVLLALAYTGLIGLPELRAAVGGGAGRGRDPVRLPRRERPAAPAPFDPVAR